LRQELDVAGTVVNDKAWPTRVGDRYLSVLDDPNEKARRAYRIVKRLLDPEVV
jgi:hypothetical protein